MLDREYRGFQPGPHPELRADVLDVRSYRVRTQEEDLGDPVVTQTDRQKPEDLLLTIGQVSRGSPVVLQRFLRGHDVGEHGPWALAAAPDGSCDLRPDGIDIDMPVEARQRCTPHRGVALAASDRQDPDPRALSEDALPCLDAAHVWEIEVDEDDPRLRGPGQADGLSPVLRDPSDRDAVPLEDPFQPSRGNLPWLHEQRVEPTGIPVLTVLVLHAGIHSFAGAIPPATQEASARTSPGHFRAEQMNPRIVPSSAATRRGHEGSGGPSPQHPTEDVVLLRRMDETHQCGAAVANEERGLSCVNPPLRPPIMRRGREESPLRHGRTDQVSRAIGEALRRARRGQRLSLRAAAARSGGRFKASSLGAYERSERRISLERFSELATLYNTSPDRLMSQALDVLDPASRKSVVIDLTRLPAVPTPERTLLEEFVQRLRDRRRDLLSEVITLRSGDVQTLALVSGIETESLMARLRPALLRESEAG